MKATAELEANFYVLGGTVPRDAPSYVVRRADNELLEALRVGNLCYVLTSRQMGKSSLMVRTVARLREEGVTCVVLDLTSIGQNLSEDQWYDGLINRIAVQLDLEEEMDLFWASHPRLGPLQRWLGALERVVLPALSGNLVLFVDEIDAVRSLPFSTDEFFAAIRSCYNRRTEDMEFQRLTFCLMGVATPADLILETRSTPFNIGNRIELRDFSSEEAQHLADGLSPTSPTPAVSQPHLTPSRTSPPPHPQPLSSRRGEQERGAGEGSRRGEARSENVFLSRVLHWTGGHPYLTQRLCAMVAKTVGTQKHARPEALVDAACMELFLSPSARHQDDNLLFVRECLLRSDLDPAELLDTYRKILTGRSVLDDETDPCITLLHLSGIIARQPASRQLKVRNRIYSQVFDKEWVRANMPDAEIRRQKMAYRRGFVRAALLGGGIVALTSWLTWTAVQKTNEARRQTARANAEAQRANVEAQRANIEAQRANAEAQHANAEAQHARQEASIARHNQYATDMALAQRAWDDKKYDRIYQILKPYSVVATGEEDLRSFEWWLLWKRCDFDLPKIPYDCYLVGDSGSFSTDGRILRSGGRDGKVFFWDMKTGEETTPTQGTKFTPNFASWQSDGNHKGIKFASPDGRHVVEGTHYEEEELQRGVKAFSTLRTLGTNRRVRLDGAMARFVFSPDSRLLATETDSKGIQVWETATGRRVRTLPYTFYPLSFTPDSRYLATHDMDFTIKLYDVNNNYEPHTLQGSADMVAIANKADVLATVDQDWNGVTVRTERTHQVLRRIPGLSCPIALSSDGTLLAGAVHYSNGKVEIWNVRTGVKLYTLKLDWYEPRGLVFSPDDRKLATHAFEGAITLWNMDSGKVLHSFPGTGIPVFSPDGKMLAVAEPGDGKDASTRRVVLYNMKTYQAERALRGGTAPVAFSPTAPLIVTAGPNSPLQLWDVRDGSRVKASFNGHHYGVDAVAFSPDGKRIVGGDGGAYDVIFWDVLTGAETFHIPGRTDRTDVASYSFVFSRDGKRFYTGSQDQVIKVWGE